MLNKEFQYYLDNINELVSKYDDKYIVIIGESVVGAYDEHYEALFETEKKHELGTFLIQKCSNDVDDYTQTFHSRVVFA